MPIEVILPKVDMDMAAGTIALWHVAEGGAVDKGAPLFDIETDKAAMEVESPGTGTLHHVSAAAGAVVPIGQTVAWIYAAGEPVGDPPGIAPRAPDADAPALENANAIGHDEERHEAAPPIPADAGRDAAGASASNGARATPAARATARAAGIVLTGIGGTGPRGRVQAGDVRRAALARSGTDLMAAPAGWTTEAGALNALRSGAGPGRPIVMIHGFAADAAGWGPLEKHLRQSAPVLRLELPSHGRSPRRSIADFAQLVREVREAFDALDTGPAHMIGHSLGGAVALAIADTRPRRVERLTVIAPAGLGPAMNGDILRAVARATQTGSLTPWLRQLVGDAGLITDSYARAAWAARAAPALRAAQSDMLDALFPDGTPAFDVTSALQRCAMPTRIIWGKADKVLPWQGALTAPGHVSLNLFDGVGHLPHVEVTQEIAALLA